MHKVFGALLLIVLFPVVLVALALPSLEDLLAIGAIASFAGWLLGLSARRK